MENPLVLSAENQEQLDLLIDEKLKQGYQLQGGSSPIEDGRVQQIMVLPRNIDSEVTFRGLLPTIILIIVFVCFEVWRNSGD